jgi:acyl-CoA synthetase (AMP-forming)/AMP-acid ligase II
MPPGPPAPAEIGSTIRRHGVTTLWLTSGLFHLMVEQRPDDLSALRQLLAGGDVLSPRHVRQALAAMPDGVVINVYGPTESTTFACCFRMSHGYQVGTTIPIGRPISNTTVFLLDEQLRPVPPGSPGELSIGGDGLARGYLNSPDRTRQKFVTSPFSTCPDALLYRTGDLARLRADGDLEFLGRIDDQVKILGHRVEPGEVEAVIRGLPGVSQASVSADTDARGEKRLVGYVVRRGNGTPAVTPAGIKRSLEDQLPPSLIPSEIVVLDALPLSPNGKVDRSPLPVTAPDDREVFTHSSPSDVLKRKTSEV